MYGIFAYIYHKNQPFMEVNIPCMDPVGMFYFDEGGLCTLELAEKPSNW